MAGSGINNKGKAVQAVQINVAKFNAWLFGTNMYGGTNINGGQSYNTQCSSASHKSHPIDSIYVYNAVPLTSATLPAVRLMNGGMLPPHTAPRGFSVATAMPLYVLGNYNVSNTTASSIGQNSTTYTWPAGLYGRFHYRPVRQLEGQHYHCQIPAPSTTTVNAAMLEGIVASTNSNYSGGLENFIRLLENWSGLYAVV